MLWSAWSDENDVKIMFNISLSGKKYSQISVYMHVCMCAHLCVCAYMHICMCPYVSLSEI